MPCRAAFFFFYTLVYDSLADQNAEFVATNIEGAAEMGQEKGLGVIGAWSQKRTFEFRAVSMLDTFCLDIVCRLGH